MERAAVDDDPRPAVRSGCLSRWTTALAAIRASSRVVSVSIAIGSASPPLARASRSRRRSASSRAAGSSRRGAASASRAISDFVASGRFTVASILAVAVVAAFPHFGSTIQVSTTRSRDLVREAGEGGGEQRRARTGPAARSTRLWSSPNPDHARVGGHDRREGGAEVRVRVRRVRGGVARRRRPARAPPARTTSCGAGPLAFPQASSDSATTRQRTRHGTTGYRGMVRCHGPQRERAAHHPAVPRLRRRRAWRSWPAVHAGSTPIRTSRCSTSASRRPSSTC